MFSKPSEIFLFFWLSVSIIGTLCASIFNLSGVPLKPYFSFGVILVLLSFRWSFIYWFIWSSILECYFVTAYTKLSSCMWIKTSKECRKYEWMSTYVNKQVKVRLALNEIQLDSLLVSQELKWTCALLILDGFCFVSSSGEPVHCTTYQKRFCLVSRSGESVHYWSKTDY